MECWVSKWGKTGAWSSFLIEFLEKTSKMQILVYKMSNVEDFFLPKTIKTEILVTKNLRIVYVHIENSFDTIFYMGYGSVKSPVGRGLRWRL